MRPSSFEPAPYTSQSSTSPSVLRQHAGAELLTHLQSTPAWDTERTEALVCAVVDAIFDEEATAEWTAAALRTLITRVPLQEGETRVMREARTTRMVALCTERYGMRRAM